MMTLERESTVIQYLQDAFPDSQNVRVCFVPNHIWDSVHSPWRIRWHKFGVNPPVAVLAEQVIKVHLNLRDFMAPIARHDFNDEELLYYLMVWKLLIQIRILHQSEFPNEPDEALNFLTDIEMESLGMKLPWNL